jgi:hypothetical protein
MKKINVGFCLLLMLSIANFTECNERISSFFLKNNNSTKTEIKENEINLKTKEELEKQNNPQAVEKDEEDWEIYSDPRVKTDPERQQLYKSLKSKFESGQFNYGLAMVELHALELKKAGVNPRSRSKKKSPTSRNKNSHYKKATNKKKITTKKNNSATTSSPTNQNNPPNQNKPTNQNNPAEDPNAEEEDDPLGDVETIGTAVNECLGAFNAQLTGDFCYKTKGSRPPEICQCGYRYYEGNCWENCKQGFYFKKGICLNENKEHYTPKFINKKDNSVFICPYGYYKSDGHCYEDCSVYNKVDCVFFFAPGCSSNSVACAMLYVNAVFSIVMGVLTIVVAVLSFGTAGESFDMVNQLANKSLKTVIREAAESARNSAKEFLSDPKKLTKFLGDVMKSAAIDVGSSMLSNVCKEVAEKMLIRTALGPQDTPEAPDKKSVVSKMAETFGNALKATALSMVPGYDAITGAQESCGGKPMDPLKCAQAVMDIVTLMDPTGVLGGVFTIAKAFMHPSCDNEDGKLEDADTDKQED